MFVGLFVCLLACVLSVILTEEAFEGHDDLRQVKCRHRVDINTSVNIITLRESRAAAAALVVLKSFTDNECTTSTSFAACTITDTTKEVRMLVADLEEGETRRHTCSIQGYHDVSSFSEEFHIHVRKPGQWIGFGVKFF